MKDLSCNIIYQDKKMLATKCYDVKIRINIENGIVIIHKALSYVKYVAICEKIDKE